MRNFAIKPPSKDYQLPMDSIAFMIVRNEKAFICIDYKTNRNWISLRLIRSPCSSFSLMEERSRVTILVPERGKAGAGACTGMEIFLTRKVSKLLSR